MTTLDHQICAHPDRGAPLPEVGLDDSVWCHKPLQKEASGGPRSPSKDRLGNLVRQPNLFITMDPRYPNSSLYEADAEAPGPVGLARVVTLARPHQLALSEDLEVAEAWIVQIADTTSDRYRMPLDMAEQTRPTHRAQEFRGSMPAATVPEPSCEDCAQKWRDVNTSGLNRFRFRTRSPRWESFGACRCRHRVAHMCCGPSSARCCLPLPRTSVRPRC